eukprot:scaffold64342_cov73-Phaeocystis_antarctica.AAC.1
MVKRRESELNRPCRVARRRAVEALPAADDTVRHEVARDTVHGTIVVRLAVKDGEHRRLERPAEWQAVAEDAQRPDDVSGVDKQAGEEEGDKVESEWMTATRLNRTGRPMESPIKSVRCDAGHGTREGGSVRVRARVVKFEKLHQAV